MTGLRRARPLLGTLVEIAVDGGLARAAAEQAIDRAFAAIARVHALMSYHDPRSELSRLNREGWLRAVSVSDETWQVLGEAQRLSAASDGLFDITVAPALERAGFLPRHADPLPASGRGGWRDVELLPDRRVRLARRVRLDLGGIAKGFAVDQAIAQLRDAGVASGSVNAGGDLRVLGRTVHTLHVRHPELPTHTLPVSTIHAAAATSAGYFQHRQWAGRRCCPIVHPGTRALCPARRSVTVLADRCLVADALTKIVFADAERASRVLAQLQARAVILDPDLHSGECRVFDSAA
jgi:thiamine biosynthesis lipoprotein